MKVILSIKPQFVEKIFNGSKIFEFRRSIFKNKEVKKILVYASAPISKVVGEFEIEEVLHMEISSLWKHTSKLSGITEKYFRDYFQGKEFGYAIKVKKIKAYKENLGIEETFGVKAPQSFAYVKTESKELQCV